MEQTTFDYDVFISYARKDYVDEERKQVIPGNEISKIMEALTNAGISYWYDKKGIYSGDKFPEVIARKMKASRVVLFISSKNSNQSRWVEREISTAAKWEKKIIPVRIDDTEYGDAIVLYLTNIDQIDYAKNPAKGLNELIRSILEDKGEKPLEEEERQRQEKIAKIKVEVAVLETQLPDLKESMLQKKREMELAKMDYEACKDKLERLAKTLCKLTEGDNSVEDAPQKVTFSVGGVSFNMIQVEGGRFEMGSADNNHDAMDREKPRHWVDLHDYYIGETVVTQELWQAVMKGNPSYFKEGCNLPVVNVAWEDKNEKNVSIMEFIRKLNDKQLSKGYEFRLPTEAEWEYAARGGQKDHGYKYSGSKNLREVAFYWKNSGDDILSGEWDGDVIEKNNCKIHPVKGKKPNELGLYDMSGNVREWCLDFFSDKYYAESPSDNPQGPSSGLEHVLRGGSWYGDARHCRVAHRGSRSPECRLNNIGFRLVLVHR